MRTEKRFCKKAVTWMAQKLLIACTSILPFFCSGCPAQGGNSTDVDAGNQDGAQSLALYSVTPASGPLGGGTTVSLSGSGFTQGVTVFFGTNAATDVQVAGHGHITCVTPAGEEAGTVVIRVETPEGDSAQLAGGFNYEDRTAVSISWCSFHEPVSTTTQVQTATEPLLGRVFAEGTTDKVGKGAGISAQVGYGPEGTDPAGDSGWVWVDAVYNQDVDEANDEYAGSLTVGDPGEYDMAYRFNGGENWIYCDLNGSDDGYSPQNTASLAIEEASEPSVDWCQLEHPPTLEVEIDSESPPIYGRVFKLGVTEGSGGGADIRGEAGYGPPGTHPATDPGWQWVEAEYNSAGPTENNDEYMASFTPTALGDYNYAYRFSYDEGPWTYCDLNSTDDGYSSDFAGNMEVTGEPSGLVDWCNLQYPLSTQVAAGEETELIFGRVFLEGSTPGSGQGGGIIGQVGYGTLGTEPSTDTGWEWRDVVYNMSVDGLVPGDLANDEYMGTLLIDTEGDFSYSLRFSKDGGNSWLYCDGDGTDNGYDPSEAGVVTVVSSETLRVDDVTQPRGTVLGGDTVTISGAGFQANATVTFGNEQAVIESVTADSIECITPSSESGFVDVTVTNPDSLSDTLTDGFEYIHASTINPDGDSTDWDSLLLLAESSVSTDAQPGYLSELYVAFDGNNLYLGILGLCDTAQTILAYIDIDYGAGTGISDTEDLSDNAGSLDDAISGTLVMTDTSFGAEFAAGTIGMATVNDGLDDSAGLRELDPPSDFPWFTSTVSTTTEFIEIAIPLSHLWPGGIPETGAHVGVVVKLLKDSFGVEYSNQTLPEDSSAESVGVTASFTIFPDGTY